MRTTTKHLTHISFSSKVNVKNATGAQFMHQSAIFQKAAVFVCRNGEALGGLSLEPPPPLYIKQQLRRNCCSRQTSLPLFKESKASSTCDWQKNSAELQQNFIEWHNAIGH
jgi:hypothetical protein